MSWSGRFNDKLFLQVRPVIIRIRIRLGRRLLRDRASGNELGTFTSYGEPGRSWRGA